MNNNKETEQDLGKPHLTGQANPMKTNLAKTSLTQTLSDQSPLSKWEQQFDFSWEDSQLTKGLRHAIVDVGDRISLSVEVGGNPNNPPLLLVIGLGSQMVFWSDNFINRLIEAGFFVIRFDNRDSGLSSKIKIPGLPRAKHLKMMLRVQAGLSNKGEPVAYNLVDMAEDTARLIKTLNLPKVNVMGASMGGIIAQILSARYPNRISHLITLFSTTNRRFLPPPKPKQFVTLFKRPESHSQKDSIRHSVWFMKTVGTPGHVNVKEVREIAKIRYNRNFHPLGTLQQLNAILATGSISKYSKLIKAPTLVLHGSKDGLVPASSGRDVAKTIPNAKFHLIDGMGHDIPDYYQPHIVQVIREHCLGG